MDLLRLLFFSFLWFGVENERCPSLYQRYSENHTYYLPPKTECKIQKNKLKGSDIVVILHEHNKYRSKVAIGDEALLLNEASSMLQMVWDNELAQLAQKHADQCVFQHDCNECRRVKNFAVGQNLYERSSFPAALKPDWPKAIKAWYDEVKDFDKEQVQSFQDGYGPPPTGHFTQMIWADTWRVGCGYTMFKRDGNVYVELYVCNYGPAGNIKDESIYKYGDRCSACPINSCCNESCPAPNYPGLCQILGNNAPEYQMTEGTFFCGFNKEPDCDTTTTGDIDRWEISNTLSGSYIGIVLKGGECTLLNFTVPFHGEKAMCLTSCFRKGPTVAGQDGTNTAREILTVPEVRFTFQTELQTNSLDFTKMSLTLNWNMPTLLSISFSVPEGEPPQYLEIKDVQVKEGQCLQTL